MRFKNPFRARGPKWLGLARYVPYPLRAARIAIEISPFAWSLKPEIHVLKCASEYEKSEGVVIWSVRYLFFGLSYRRWV